MQPEQQQRIMGYFIEEAKDHLNTIEQGLLNLQRTLDDAEIVNEMFRAAHSVKGGAAMLGLSSIQHVGHRLEDFFKVMSETPIRADQRLETLLLRVFDALQALIEQLQGPFGLTEDSATRIVADVEPLFGELDRHLSMLKQGATPRPTATTTEADLELALDPVAIEEPFPNPFEPAWKVAFRNQVPAHLREMLQLFKGAETVESRNRLHQICDQLIALGADPELTNWHHLLTVSRQAIDKHDNAFRNLAPVIIREIKQAQDLIWSDQEAEVAPSSLLIDMAAVSAEPALPDSLADVLSLADLTEPPDLTADMSLDAISEPFFFEVSDSADATETPGSADDLDQLFNDFLAAPTPEQQGPEVGMVELNTLADLFESELPDLGEVWQEEEITPEAGEETVANFDATFIQGDSDLSDLLFAQESPSIPETSVQDDFNALFGDALEDSSSDDKNSDTVIQEVDAPLNEMRPETDRLDLDDLFGGFNLDESVEMSEQSLASLELEQTPALDDLADIFAGIDDQDLTSEVPDSLAQEEALITSAQPLAEPTTSSEVPDPWSEETPEGQPEPLEAGVSLADMDFSSFLSEEEDASFDQLFNEDDFPSQMGGRSSELDELDFSELLDSPEPPLMESLDALSQPSPEQVTSNLEADLWGLPDQPPEELFANPEVVESLMAEALEIAQESGSVNLNLESGALDAIADPWGDFSSAEVISETTPVNQEDIEQSIEPLSANPQVLESLLAEALEMSLEAGDIHLEEARFAQEQTQDLSNQLAEMLEQTETPAVWLEEAVIQIYESELPSSEDSDILSETEFVLDTNYEDLEGETDLLDEFLDLNPLPGTSSLFLSQTDYVLAVNLEFNPPISFEVFDSLLEVNPIAEIEAIVYYTEVTSQDDPSYQPLNAQDLEPVLENEEIDLTQWVEDTPDFLADIPAGEDTTPVWSQDEVESTLSDFVVEQDLLGERRSELASEEFPDFADLDALLGENAETTAPVQSQIPTSTPESDFDELDALLKEAEETLGGSPSVKGARTLGSQLRRPVRQGRVFGEQTMRVPVKHLDSLSNLVGELVVNRNSLEQDQERLRQSLDNLLYQVQQLGDVGQRMQDLYERSLLETSLLARRTDDSTATLGVEYDPLEMDRFTGFHSLSQEMIELIVRVRESASDIEFVVDETEQVTRTFRQVTTQLQEGLNRSRMVPFAQIADRLPRAVRDISLKMGKQAELVIEGRDTLIDKMILEQLYDPMTHLVNNAITHGIESSALRRGAGKPPIGRIVVRAFHQGNQTVISVSDDGSGINVDRVKEKAIEKRLVTPAEAKSMSRLDVYDVLFHPGFTTKDQADDFSGRGVGMDVVRTCLNEIRGTITTDSNPGRGTTFTIRLPLTLSISKALCCISDRARIAFPMDGVEDMLDVPKERIHTDAQGNSSFTWRDVTLSIQPLSQLLTYNRHMSRGNVYGGGQDENVVSIVVLRSAGNYLALQVDQVLGEQEIVIKQLEGPVPKPVGIAGATVLGDGRIMPIADVLELIDLSMGRIRRDAGSSLWTQGSGLGEPDTAAAKTEPTVLIVDDSITVRELLSITFSKVGYRVEQARDGQEAWEKLRSGMPCDIVFCDIEMPRMDGLELLSRIQKDAHLNRIPIAMLTSRGADRHRQMAISLGAKGYFTKPYLEEALLDAAQRMLKGEMLTGQP